jgi:hypothetical protein
VVVAAILGCAVPLQYVRAQTLPVAGNPQGAISADREQRDAIRGVREQDAAAARVARELNANTPAAAGQAVPQTVGGSDELLRAGIVIDGRNPNRMIIQQVTPNSAAAMAGLRAGDVITRVNGNPVTSISALAQSLLAGTANKLGLQVDRNGQSRQLNLNLSDNSVRTAMRKDVNGTPTQSTPVPPNVGTSGQVGQTTPTTTTNSTATSGAPAVSGTSGTSAVSGVGPAGGIPGAATGTSGFGAATTGTGVNATGSAGLSAAATGAITGTQQPPTTTANPPLTTPSNPAALGNPTSPSLQVQPDRQGGAILAAPQAARLSVPGAPTSPGAPTTTGDVAPGGTIGNPTVSSQGTVSPTVGGGVSSATTNTAISGNTVGAPTTSSQGTVVPGVSGGSSTTSPATGAGPASAGAATSTGGANTSSATGTTGAAGATTTGASGATGSPAITGGGGGGGSAGGAGGAAAGGT